VITLKKFFSCEESGTPNTYQGYFTFDFSPYYSPGWVCESVTAAPTGFTEVTDFSGNLIGYTVIGAAAGVHEIIIQAGNFGGSYTEYLLEFTFQSSCGTEQDIECCSDSVTLKWLGVEGAIKQWVFPGVREFEIKTGDANTFKNSSKQIQYSERKDIYTGKRISIGNVTQDQLDFISECKYAIQVWEFDGTDYTPILVNNDSFFKYKTTDKFFDVSIQYILSDEIQVQTA